MAGLPRGKIVGIGVPGWNRDGSSTKRSNQSRRMRPATRASGRCRRCPGRRRPVACRSRRGTRRTRSPGTRRAAGRRSDASVGSAGAAGGSSPGRRARRRPRPAPGQRLRVGAERGHAEAIPVVAQAGHAVAHGAEQVRRLELLVREREPGRPLERDGLQIRPAELAAGRLERRRAVGVARVAAHAPRPLEPPLAGRRSRTGASRSTQTLP